jgi:uncharacterized membrane protein (UPF0182 family)
MHFSEAQVDVVAAETFGRDAAMFQSLLSFMTSVSLTLWVLVLVTLIVRFVACHVLYRRRELQSGPANRSDADGT